MQPYTGQMGGGYYGQGHGIYSSQPYMNQKYQGAWHRPTQTRIPFLTTLNLPNLSILMNDLVSYDPAWPAVPTKLPSDLPKFEGKPGEDPSEHITTFHLWCSSNSLHQDSVHLQLFQRTLTGPATKWYIELPKGAFTLFDNLAMNFFNHFQLPVRYDVGTELLSTFQQDKATHISDHIQEWCRWKRLIKAFIAKDVAKDVSTSGV